MNIKCYMAVFKVRAWIIEVRTVLLQQVLSGKLNKMTIKYFFRMLSQFSDEDPCAGLDFQKATCETKLEKCFEKKFSAEMKDFFVERAIQFKQWMIFAKKLLDIHHAKESLDNFFKAVVP